jgi:hypothetical protein
MGKRKKILVGAAVAPLTLCLVGALILAVVNSRRAEASAEPEVLDARQQALVNEAQHLRLSLGDAVWPGFGSGDIPLLVYNEASVFLTGYEGAPPAGWRTVPNDRALGRAWEPADSGGMTYYRASLPASGEDPQAFVVLVGDRPVASLPTQEWMRLELEQQFQNDLPGPLTAVFPYRLVSGFFIGQSETYVTALLHEGFHAHVLRSAPERLLEAERIQRQEQDNYPWEDDAFIAAWEEELRLLQSALRADGDAEMESLARAFLGQRDARRREAGLTPALIAFEQAREWVEGLAKYTELGVYRAAAESPGYRSLLTDSDVDDFAGYEKYEDRWNQEVGQITRMAADHGDGRFYYSGMAQGVLLDRLLPAWKERALAPGVQLEDLLREAVGDGAS